MGDPASGGDIGEARQRSRFCEYFHFTGLAIAIGLAAAADSPRRTCDALGYTDPSLARFRTFKNGSPSGFWRHKRR